MITQKFSALPLWALSIISGALFIMSWFPYTLPLVFIAFIPLLEIEKQIRSRSGKKASVFGYAFLTFFVWNLGTTWWLKNATIEGAAAAIVINSLLMCLPVMIYHSAMRKYNVSRVFYVFIFAWLSFEYLHHTWEFSWPWLKLGNAFAIAPWAIQWYEYTGVAGGSFWILITNVQFFKLYSQPPQSASLQSKLFNIFFFFGFAPLFLSWYVGNKYTNTGIPITVAVVQPNIDPYHDKFEGLKPIEQTEKMLQLALNVIDSSTQLVCFPETALLGDLDESWLNNSESVYAVRQKLLNKYPQLNILTGADSYQIYQNAKEKTFTARKFGDQLFYDAFNTALLINKKENIQVYHKSKLVPGVEAIPYEQYLGFLKQTMFDLGGTTGSLGRNKEASNFSIGIDQQVAPVICYESVFGEYVASFVLKGAGLLCVITNDGWWGNTPGHRHHFNYARLRAIETRRYVARSANTGISGFIDDKGNVLSETQWWQADSQQAVLQYNSVITFYVQNAFFIEILPLLFLVFTIIGLRKMR